MTDLSSTNWRALCAELHAVFNTYAVCEEHHRLLVRIAAALSQPESQGPTDEEIEERFQRWWFSEGSGMRPLNGEDQEEHAHRVSQVAWHNGAYVERSGRPAIEPVPQQEVDLLLRKQCWMPGTPSWIQW
jgi:hypothetical protein